MAQGTSFGGLGFGLRSGATSNSRLILEAQPGEATAFEELVEGYESPVMKIALVLTNSEDSARQIYYRVFTEAFAGLENLDSGPMFVWMYRILVKHCIAFCRRSRGVEPACVATDSSPSLARMLGILPPRQRVMFALKHVQQLKVGTLAEIFACSPEHIEEALRNGARRLQMHLALRVLLQS